MPVDFTLARMPSGIVIHRAWHNEAWRLSSPESVVAIPACNEAIRIGECLAGLSSQTTRHCGMFGVLVLVNSTSDDTFRQVVAHGRRHSLPLCVVNAEMPPERRDAGAARCMAMHLAAAALPEATAVFTTDADSRAPVDWIATYSQLLASGYDAVAGVTDIDPADADDMPHSLKQRDQFERRYETCLDALECWLDPVEHDPWPRHFHASGANLALSRHCIASLAQLSWPSTGEDKWLLNAMDALDLRIRHDTSQKVLTSGRLFGRARGGMAATLRRRVLDPASACDERLETVDRAYFRARTRHLVRMAHRQPCSRAIDMLAARLLLRTQIIEEALSQACFGSAWHAIEAQAMRLNRVPLAPDQLAVQCARGEGLLARLAIPAATAEGCAAAESV